MNEYRDEIVIVKSIDAIDERRSIKIGDKAEIVNYDEAGMPCILLKTGLAKDLIYCMNKEQLEVVKA